MPHCVICGKPLKCSNPQQHPEPVTSHCALAKGAIWVHVMDDLGASLKGVEVGVKDVKNAKTPDSGFARFDPLDADNYTATLSKLDVDNAKLYEPPALMTSAVGLGQGEVAYVSFQLKRKPNLSVRVAKKKDVSVLFDKAAVVVTGQESPPEQKTALGLTDFGKRSAGDYTVCVTLGTEDAKKFFTPEKDDVTLVTCVDQEVLVKVEEINVVTPKIQVEYKVVLLDRKLSAHQAGGEAKIFADPTYVLASFSETNTDYPHATGAKLVVDPADAVEVYVDADCKTKLAGDLTRGDLTKKDDPKKLYLRGAKAGTFTLSLELNDPADKDVKKIKLDKNPATADMAVVELVIEAYSAKKAHSKVFVDDSDPAHAALSDEAKIKSGRLLVLQENGRQGRAKVVLKKPADILWTTGEATYEVHLLQKGSGALKLYDAETAGNLKHELANGALKLKKADFTGDLPFWVEGAGVSDSLRDTWLHLALDRPDADPPHTVKAHGDVARFTVVQITKVTPDTNDYKQYLNLPADVSHPERGRKLKSKATVAKGLVDVKILFTLVPDATNRVDLLAKLKYQAPKDTDAAVVTVAGVAESAELSLSHFARDKFQIAAYLAEAPPPKALPPASSCSKPIEVWQEVFYQYATMTKDGGGTYDDHSAALEAGFAPAKVKVTRVGAVQTPAHAYFVTAAKATTWANGVLGAPGDRTMNIALIDTILGDPGVFPQISFAGMNGAGGYYVEVFNYATDPTTLGNKATWLVAATCSYTDVGNLPVAGVDVAAHTTMTHAAGKFTIRWDLSSLAGVAKPGTVGVAFDLRHLPMLSGLSSGATTIVGMRFRALGPGQPDENTVLHEAGHYLGLAPNVKPNAAASGTGVYYLQNGNHCNNGGNTCVMYHMASTNLVFCAICLDALSARDLSGPPVWGASPF